MANEDKKALQDKTSLARSWSISKADPKARNAILKSQGIQPEEEGEHLGSSWRYGYDQQGWKGYGSSTWHDYSQSEASNHPLRRFRKLE